MICVKACKCKKKFHALWWKWLATTATAFTIGSNFATHGPRRRRNVRRPLVCDSSTTELSTILVSADFLNGRISPFAYLNAITTATEKNCIFHNKTPPNSRQDFKPWNRQLTTNIKHRMHDKKIIDEILEHSSRGVTRLNGARARSKFGAPKFESGIFRKQNVLHWRKHLWHCWDFSAPGESGPPRYAPV